MILNMKSNIVYDHLLCGTFSTNSIYIDCAANVVTMDEYCVRFVLRIIYIQI